MQTLVTRAIPQLFYDFVKKVEACKLVGYPDSGGKPTWGYGHTGPEVQIGETITQATADTDLTIDASNARRRAYEVMDEASIIAMTDHQWAAILAFIFNCGAVAKDSIWAVCNSEQWDAVPAKLMQYTHEHKNGQVVEVPGLVNRRMAEVSLWKTPDADAAAAIVTSATVQPPPSSYTRDAVTPPVVATKPLHPSFLALCGAAVCSAPDLVTKATSGVSKLSDAITPFAANSPVVQHTVEHLATAGAALTVVGLAALYLKGRFEKAHG